MSIIIKSLAEYSLFFIIPMICASAIPEILEYAFLFIYSPIRFPYLSKTRKGFEPFSSDIISELKELPWPPKRVL